MTITPMADDLRAKIIANPDVLLEDHAVMRALVGANDDQMGRNVVDLRSVAMARLAARLDRLEEMHRTVIAAAYDNLAGINQVQRAVLRLLEADRLETFLTDLAGDVAGILRVDAIRLVLEDDTPVDMSHPAITIMPPGYIDGYITLGRNTPARQVTLRALPKVGGSLYAAGAHAIASEACLKIAPGPSAMLAMGSADLQMFTPQQGTDLLTFFADTVERVLRRLLV